ncbi:unnamed protein product [Paramecium primaurelia]|uniref:Transmembrane protein n=1 Tax=Paramecium primaurelia TaxID=5886 RepID=A0A8S1LBW6_PARPR|nr:unnamed protein product [Paramecium primaurelia]
MCINEIQIGLCVLIVVYGQIQNQDQKSEETINIYIKTLDIINCNSYNRFCIQYEIFENQNESVNKYLNIIHLVELIAQSLQIAIIILINLYTILLLIHKVIDVDQKIENVEIYNASKLVQLQVEIINARCFILDRQTMEKVVWRQVGNVDIMMILIQVLQEMIIIVRKQGVIVVKSSVQQYQQSQLQMNNEQNFNLEMQIQDSCQLMIGSENRYDESVYNQCQERKFENASKTNNIDDLGEDVQTQKKLSNIYTGIVYDYNDDIYTDSDGECTLGLCKQKVRVFNDAQRKEIINVIWIAN